MNLIVEDTHFGIVYDGEELPAPPVRSCSREHDLGIREQTIYLWCRQHLVDTGQQAAAGTAERSRISAAVTTGAGKEPRKHH